MARLAAVIRRRISAHGVVPTGRRKEGPVVVVDPVVEIIGAIIATMDHRRMHREVVRIGADRTGRHLVVLIMARPIGVTPGKAVGEIKDRVVVVDPIGRRGHRSRKADGILASKDLKETMLLSLIKM